LIISNDNAQTQVEIGCTKNLAVRAWASEGFFPGEANSEFLQGWPKGLFQWEATVVKFHFFNFKPSEQSFSTGIYQISGSMGFWPHYYPFRRP